VTVTGEMGEGTATAEMKIISNHAIHFCIVVFVSGVLAYANVKIVMGFVTAIVMVQMMTWPVRTPAKAHQTCALRVELVNVVAVLVTTRARVFAGARKACALLGRKICEEEEVLIRQKVLKMQYMYLYVYSKMTKLIHEGEYLLCITWDDTARAQLVPHVDERCHTCIHVLKLMISRNLHANASLALGNNGVAENQ